MYVLGRGGLLRHRLQSLFDRQPGRDEGGELTGEQHAVQRSDPTRQLKGETLSRFLDGAFPGGFHAEGNQTLVAQQLTDLADAVRLQDALALAPSGIKRCVLECRHVGAIPPG